MSQTVKGVISRSKGAATEVVDVVVPDPGPRDVIVKIQACGVCHTDLAYKEGGINDEYPFLLGHEAAGIVETIGSEVTHVEVGDFVVLNWRAVCGECRACKRGRPWYCFNTHNASKSMTLTDGTELDPGAGHRRVHREDPHPRGTVHQGQSRDRSRRRRTAGLRRHGRTRCRDEHRQRRSR
ncbi:putative aryl-alcohol dehydrogenase [Gordonia rhizosphera NBRC 16068]|uniref:alcohol dehydrogenase n=1 Tax=Gordonia rhizosphera NBRC 16068 TaxID=1108045 RepID=K6X4Z6_9ACTN|nr:putative aryl-alcohol dehydrogenase [Gordonia rhizosphera NBRC 16068]